jgi:uncharacterized protein (TIGR02145 family)
MKTINSTIFSVALTLIIGTSAILSSCSEEETATKAKVNATEAADVTFNSATISVTIESVGTGPIKAKGVCYGPSSLPTVEDDTTMVEGDETTFSSYLSGLVNNTTYYARAYVINKAGVSYSNEVSFTTMDGLPTVTAELIAATYKRATTQLNIVSLGGSAVTNAGFVYSTEHAVPTTSDNMWVSDFIDSPIYNHFQDLNPGTTYYLRAFAQNNFGTAYSDVIQFTTKSAPSQITDVDGNTYDVVIIGDYAWLKDNLRVTRYNNGDVIGTTTVDITNEATPKYQWAYNNDEANAATYGRYYTHFAMADPRKVCPAGTHLSTHEEWTNLNNAPGITGVGAKIKATGTTYWNAPNTAAANEYGFNALGAGYRATNNSFASFKEHAYFLTEYEIDADRMVILNARYDNSFLWLPYMSKKNGYSIRCVVD